MKPVTSFIGSLTVTATLLLGLGYLASQIPVSTAAEYSERSGTIDSVTRDTGLQVEITHVRNDQGKVIVLVFDDEGAYNEYDYNRAVAYAETAASTGTVEARFPELDAGPYAIALWHDENGDYDLNMDGDIPLEGYGTSGAKTMYDEPTFRQASVNRGRVAVRMFYLD